MGNLPLNIDLVQILLHFLNFVILFAIMYFVLYKPVRKIMDERTQYYKKMEDDANANLASSEEKKAEYEAKLQKADEEIKELKEAAGKAGNEERERIIKSAKDEGASIIAAAKANATAEHDKIVADAQKEIAEIVDKATEKIVMDSNVDSYDSFLKSVDENKD